LTAINPIIRRALVIADAGGLPQKEVVVPRIRKLSNHEIKSLNQDDVPAEGAPAAGSVAAADGVAPAPEEAGTPARRRRRAADAPVEQAPEAAPLIAASAESAPAPAARATRARAGQAARPIKPATSAPPIAEPAISAEPEPVLAVAHELIAPAAESNGHAPRARANNVARPEPPVPPAPTEPPEEATVVLLPVELPLAERRGELVHLTLGAGVTLCGTSCDPEPASSRPYSVAAGCQRCARMLHRLKARCANCGHPLLHLTGSGACIRCRHVGAIIQLP
jgi:hypothetical protein